MSYPVKRFFFIMAICLTGGLLFAQNNNFKQGELLFLQNKPEEALAYLEAAVAAPDASLQAHLYLGMAYQQLNRPDDAAAVYTKILPDAGDSAALVAYSLGNVYYGKGDFALAEASYTQAIVADNSFAPAYLNRANARLQTGEVEQAVADYTYYLVLDSDAPQRSQIEAVLAAIEKNESDAAAERRRKAEEEAAVLAKTQERERQAKESVPAILAALQSMEDIAVAMKAQEEAAEAQSTVATEDGGAVDDSLVSEPADAGADVPPVDKIEPDASENSETPRKEE
ncbi:MAG: tetratricopeptide repeat protein [Treponema sp.]|jgi:tetratricopeptide (TPR) repeat protein|nr:tetratricopeptide repeat protein [Treponema sp.]